MGKYLYLIKLNIALVSAHRGEIAFSFLRRITLVVIMITLWSITVQEGTDNKYIPYFSLFYFLFDPLTTGRAGGKFVKDVLTGNINSFLLKPIYYPAYRIIDILTVILTRIALPILLLVFAIIFKPETFGPASLGHLLIFIPTGIVSIFLFQLMMILMANLSFWFGNMAFLFTVYGLIIKFVNGGLIPISEYSTEVRDILFFLPTSYAGGIEVDIYLGRYSLGRGVLAFFVVLGWTLFFAYINHIVYSKGLSKLEAVGG